MGILIDNRCKIRTKRTKKIKNTNKCQKHNSSNKINLRNKNRLDKKILKNYKNCMGKWFIQIKCNKNHFTSL
jgi:hypothetical protein